MKTYLYLHDDDVEIVIDVDYDAHYQAAYVNGPPEDCYPEDSEMTINGFKVISVKQMGEVNHAITSEEIDAVFQENIERLEEECWEHYDSRQKKGWAV
jgi:hypothetical protein